MFYINLVYSLFSNIAFLGVTCGWQIYFDSHDRQDKKHIEWVE
jgi:hypothetical protein